MTIAGQASAFLREQGVDQWQNGYPSPAHFEADIAEGSAWLFTHNDTPAGCVTVRRAHEAPYDRLFGQWLTDSETPYAVVHRIAVADGYRGRGLAGEMLQFAEDISLGTGAVSLRIDTHEQNAAMRALLEKRGYTRCGLLWIDEIVGDKLRVAYEKILT